MVVLAYAIGMVALIFTAFSYAQMVKAFPLSGSVYNYVGRRMAKGPELVKGLALAVEPMVNLGSRATRVLDDGWTVVTEDGFPSAHFEHTFTLTERGPWVLTALDGGEARLAALGALQATA